MQVDKDVPKNGFRYRQGLELTAGVNEKRWIVLAKHICV